MLQLCLAVMLLLWNAASLLQYKKHVSIWMKGIMAQLVLSCLASAKSQVRSKAWAAVCVESQLIYISRNQIKHLY